MRSLIIAFTALSLGAFAAPAAASCLEFTALTPGTSAGVGPLLTLPDGNVRLEPFTTGGGSVVTTGTATVVNSNWAAGSPPNELQLTNINLVVNPIPDVVEAKFRYADWGGNVNFGVNGVVANVADLSDLGTLVSPGVYQGTLAGIDLEITRTNMAGFHFGIVYMTAPIGMLIQNFGVGGQEFFVDDICW